MSNTDHNEELRSIKALIATIMHRDSLVEENDAMRSDLNETYEELMEAKEEIKRLKSNIYKIKTLNYSIFDFQKIDVTGTYQCQSVTDISGEYVARTDIERILGIPSPNLDKNQWLEMSSRVDEE